MCEDEYVPSEYMRAALKYLGEELNKMIIGHHLSCMPEWELCEEP